MKKIILILLLIPIVEAKAYYTDYTEWEKVKQLPNMAQDLIETKEIKSYLWYKKEKIGKYFSQTENHGDYIKTPFWTYSDWSNWSLEKPKEGEIEIRKRYHYQTVKPILWIRLSNIKTEELKFTTIKIYNGDKQISFQIHQQKEQVLFELSEPCNFDELEISFTMIELSNNEKSFKIEWLYNLNLPSCMETTTRYWFQGAWDVNYRYRNLMPNQIIWEDIKTTLEKVEENPHTKVSIETQYRNRSRLQYYEKEIRIYDKEYHTTMPTDYPFKDLESEKKQLYIRTRKKVDSIEKTTYETNFIPEPIKNAKTLSKTMPPKEEFNQEWKNAMIASIQNDQSNEREKNNHRNLKKGSFSFFSFTIFLIGIIVGKFSKVKKDF